MSTRNRVIGVGLLCICAVSGPLADSSLIIGTQLDPENWDGMGMQVFFISSINGDATPEIISTAHCTNTNGPLCGSISCYDGAADPETQEHALIWRVDGEHAYDQLGESARNSGDLDGDGFDDILIAARLDDTIGPNAGMVRLLSGVDGRELLRIYPEAGDTWFGKGLASPGDLDGDSVPDLAIGSPHPNTGALYIFSGADGAQLSRYAGPGGTHAGHALAAIADIDGDGLDEILIGGPGRDEGRGGAWLLNGARAAQPGSPLRQLLIHSWSGSTAGAHFGETVSGVGDLDGDGSEDLAIGAPGIDTIFLYSGASGALLHRIEGGGASGGAPLEGIGKVEVAVAGDLNGDGHDDLLIGAPWANKPDAWHSGRADLISGYDWTLIRSFEAYYDLGDCFGASFGTGGDLDGSGIPDLLIGIPGYGDFDAGTAYGAVYIETF
jgi:hypothetical protein